MKKILCLVGSAFFIVSAALGASFDLKILRIPKMKNFGIEKTKQPVSKNEGVLRPNHRTESRKNKKIFPICICPIGVCGCAEKHWRKQ